MGQWVIQHILSMGHRQHCPHVPPSVPRVLARLAHNGGAPLEESLANYERGMALLKQCQEALTGAEQKIRILESGSLRDFNAAGENAES